MKRALFIVTGLFVAACALQGCGQKSDGNTDTAAPSATTAPADTTASDTTASDTTAGDTTAGGTSDASSPALPAALSAEANAKFLSDSARQPGTIVRPSGLQYRVITSGNGKSPQYTDDQVTVTYKGWLIDGTVFDQTPEGQTATFPAGGLIPGWVEALSLMKEGDEWEIVLPSKLAYGEDGAGGGKIPPNQTLVFRMKLVSVKSAKH